MLCYMHNLYEPKDVPENIKIIVLSHFMKIGTENVYQMRY